MMTTKIENNECDNKNEVKKSFQNESSRILKNDISSVFPQGGILSSLLGEVKVEVNHKVPMVDRISENISNIFSSNPFDFSIENMATLSVFHWYLCALIFMIIMFSVGGMTNKFAKFGFIVTLGIGNILGAMAFFNFEISGRENLLGLTAEIRKAYDDMCTKADYEESCGENKTEDVVMETIEPQGLSPDFVATLLLVTLSAGLGFAPKSGGLNAVKEYLKMTPVSRANMFESVCSSLSFVGSLSEKMNCPNFLSAIFDIPVTDTSVVDWVDRVNVFMNKVSTHTDGSLEDNTVAYNSFVAESKLLEKTLQKGSVSHITLIDTIKNLERCKNAMNRRFASLKGFRPEPVMVYLMGAPATVKSTLSGRLADIINRVTLGEDLQSDYCAHPDTYIYRKSTDKWWEGYTSKANVTIIDDLFQVVDNGSTPAESEASAIIRMTNTEEFAVPMANAENKNSVFFRSNFILATGNQYSDNLINSVHNKDAIRRRLHFFVNVKVSAKYKANPNDPKDNSINHKLLPLLTDMDGNLIEDCTKLPTDFWEFTYNEVDGPSIPTSFAPIDYHTLVEKIVKKHFKHKKNFEVNRLVAEESFTQEANIIFERLRPVKDQYSRLMKTVNSKRIVNLPMSFVGAFPQSGIQDDRSDSSDDDIFFNSSESSEFLNKSYKSGNRKTGEKVSYYDAAHYKGCCEEYHSRLPVNLRLILFKDFVSSAYDYQKIDVWLDDPVSSFIQFIDDQDSLAVKNLMRDHSKENLSDQDFAYQFAFICRNIMRERYDNDCNIMTGKPLSISESLDMGKNKFYTCFKFCIDYTSRNKLRVIMLVTASSAIVYALYKFIRTVNGEVSPQSFSRNGEMAKGPSRSRNPPKKPLAKPKESSVVISQSGNTLKTLLNGSSFRFDSRSAHKDVLTSLIDKNQFIMYIHKQVGDKITVRRLGHCVNLRSNHFGMPYHFILDLEDYMNASPLATYSVIMTTASNSRKFSMELNEFLQSVTSTTESQETDFCIFTGGPEPLAKGAMHYFIDNKDEKWKRKVLTPISIIGSRQHGEHKEHTSFRLIETQASFLKEKVIIQASWKTEDNMTHYGMLNTLSYAGDFSAGDCGSLVVFRDESLGSRIVAGLHVAGTPKTGYSNIISTELIQSLLDVVDFETVVESEVEPQGLTRLDTLYYDYLEPQLTKRGFFDSKYSVAQCSRSEITKSAIYGKLPGEYGVVRTRPSLLYAKEINGILIDPKKLAIQNYARFPPPIEENVVKKAVGSYFQIIDRYDDVKRIGKVIYDIPTALTHFGDHVKSIASNTSSGWPMNTSSTEDLKKLYFKAILKDDIDLRDATLVQITARINEIEDQYSQNIRPVFIYSDALKDETRPIDKYLAGKTRMFSGCPFDLLIEMRRYFGAFIDYFFDKNLQLGSAIGVNPYSADWHVLAQNLLKFSSNDGDLAIGAGDYSKFDCSQSPLVLNGILEIINAWYNGNSKDDRIRRLLWLEITNSRHIFGNEYYEWFSGLPSGNPMTAVINTMYNQLAFRMAWHYCDLSIDLYNANVYMCALGDDNVFSVHPNYRDNFNELTLVKSMRCIGLTYTTEIKGTATVPFRKLSQVEFLKRSFAPFKLNFLGGEKRYLAPIQIDSIINMLNWSKKGSNRDQITRDNIALALREFSLHGRDTYDYFKPILVDLADTYLPGVKSHHASHTDFKAVLSDTLNLEHEF